MSLLNFVKSHRSLKLRQPLNLKQQAGDEKTPGDRLIQLAEISLDLARIVASNPATPPECLRKLSQHSDEIIRSRIAANPNTPTDLLLKLAAEFPSQLFSNPIFSLLFLENPNLLLQMPEPSLMAILKSDKTPPFILELAVKQGTGDVKYQVAMNPKTPKDLLHQLTRYSAAIRYAVAQNPNTSTETLYLLLQNSNQVVRIAAQANLNTRL